MSHITRPILPEDIDAIAATWQDAFGPRWPVDRPALATATGFLVEDSAGVAGVALCDDMALLALYTRRDVRRTGIATTLHNVVLDAASAAGQPVHLGAGHDYFWPGVPVDDLAAVGFFEHHGWVFDHEVADLIGDPRHLTLPPARPGDHHIQVSTLDAASCAHATFAEFADRDFPQWAPYYASTPPSRLLVALDDALVVGTAIMTLPDDPADPVPWHAHFASPTGALSGVAVSPTAQGRGVGSRLVVAGAERLAAVGTTGLYLGWVWRTSFYERLGCQVWRRYRVAAPRHPS